jgi:UDP-N-acetylmuramate--alanine ligase
VPLPEPASLAEMVNAIAKPGDYVVCLGAGSITGWAHALPEQLAGLQAQGGHGPGKGARVTPLRRA